MWVRLLQDWGGMGKGSVIDVSERQAQLLITSSIAILSHDPAMAAPEPTRETAIKSKHEIR